MNLSPEEIRTKFHQTGVLLMLDPPKQLELGIDNMCWTVGHKFRGIKLIPLGTHIINYSLKSEANMFPIHQFLHFSRSGPRD